MSPPRTALFGATRSVEQPPAGGRREQKAARHRAASHQSSVIAQCDRCGATDDAEVRLRRAVHADCGGTFRLYGHVEVRVDG